MGSKTAKKRRNKKKKELHVEIKASPAELLQNAAFLRNQRKENGVFSACLSAEVDHRWSAVCKIFGARKKQEK